MSSFVLAMYLTLPALGFLTDGDVSSKAGMTWSRDYGQAKREAHTAKRPLLVVIENPDNGKQRLNEEQLTADRRQADLLDEFHLCRIDASTKYGKLVAEAFKARQLPFAAIIDKESEVILFRKAGQMTQREWRDALVRIDAKSARLDKRVVLKSPITTTDFGSSLDGPHLQPFAPSGQACFT